MTQTLREREASAHAVAPGFGLAAPQDFAQVIAWLAGVFARPPGIADIWSYRKGPAAAWLDALGRIDALAPGVGRLRAAVDDSVSDHDLAARLGALHTSLFSGAGGPNTVAPYESAHMGSGRLFQAPAAEMARLLRRHDVHVADLYAEAPDHLAVQLALLAQLTAAGHPDAAALLNRLMRWTPRFAAQCLARDSSGYWSGAAQALTALLATAAPDACACPKPYDPDKGGCDERYEQA